MSIVYLTSHNECIYDLNPTTTVSYQKAPRYTSIHKEKLTEKEKKCSKKFAEHAHMGLPEEKYPDPQEYLKKNTGKPSYTKHAQDCISMEPKQTRKDKTPNREDCLKAYKKPSTEENILERNKKKLGEIKHRDPKCLVACPLMVRPPEPIHIFSKKFGKTPEYLNKIIEENNRRKEQLTKKVIIERDNDKQTPGCHQVSNEEREKLLEGLKANWRELQSQFQVLPILTDTAAKVINKVKLENQLKQLEKDILLIERHPCIYVYDEDK